VNAALIITTVARAKAAFAQLAKKLVVFINVRAPLLKTPFGVTPWRGLGRWVVDIKNMFCCSFRENPLSLHHHLYVTIMTSMELNQELFRQLAIVASDENLMRKTIKAIKRIIEKKEEQDTTEQILASPAMMEIIHKGDEEIAGGNVTPIKLEELWK